METTSQVRQKQKTNFFNGKRLPYSLRIIRLFFKYIGPLFPTLAAQCALKMFMTPKKHKNAVLPEIFENAFILGIPYSSGKIRAYMFGYTGPIIVLVHGWESGCHAFEAIIPALASTGYRVIVMEGPAHGSSKQKRTHMIDFGNALQALIERMEKSGGVTAVIGHSFGGSTLTNVFARFSPPKTLDKMILIAIPARIDHVFERYFAMLKLPSVVCACFKDDIKNLLNLELDALQVKNWVSHFTHIKALLIHDKQDKVIPFREAEMLITHWPSATLLETENLGHNRILKSELLVERIIQFIQY